MVLKCLFTFRLRQNESARRHEHTCTVHTHAHQVIKLTIEDSKKRYIKRDVTKIGNIQH